MRLSARFSSALVAGLAALSTFSPSAGADEIVVEGPHVVVRSTVESKATAERCRDALEAAVPVYERHLPYRLPPGERLVVHLYAKAEEFAQAVTAGGAAALAKNLAATLNATKESHVVLQPRADAKYLALVGDLPELTRFLVCHEGVHQFVRRAGASGCELWPDWYGEGMADYLADACLSADAGGATIVPVHVDDKRVWVAEAFARGRAPSLERLLYAEQYTVRDLHGEYSYWEELYRHLAADGPRMKRLHAGLAGLGLPGQPAAGARDDRRLVHARACAEVLTKTYGPLDAIEAGWRAQTLATHPTWFEPVRASQRVGDELVCAGFPGSNAILASALPPLRKPYTLSCELNLLGIGGRQADLFFGLERGDELRFLKLALGADGFVTLLANSDGFWQDRFIVNAPAPADTIPTDAWVAVRVLVDRARIRVEIRGKALFDAAVPPGFDVLGGTWGLGATNDVVRFRNVVVRAEVK